jgi:tetratricopeptide (TPR) repeat protein
MNHRDQFGVSHTAADAAAVRHYDAALAKLLTLNNDPLAEANLALTIDPGFLMARVLKSVATVLGTDSSLHGEVHDSLAVANLGSVPPSIRERKHLAALQAWLEGRFPNAVALWEDILVEEPRDALAMFAAHQGDFLLGVSSELRDRVARRLPSIEGGSALEGYYHGMYAFGLEETGDYARATEFGTRAVQRDPRDAWAIHAVAHVHEMTNHLEEGERWLTSRIADWATDNFFAVHNWWHLALYYVDRERWNDVLALYDQRVRAVDSAVIFDLLDATSLLWRLKLHAVDVGDRWTALIAAWEPHIDDAWYAFNDLHAAMAFVGGHRLDLARRLVSRLTGAALSDSPNGAATRRVGLPFAQALLAYGEGRYEGATASLLPVKSIAAQAGGSHAQRDVIGLTLMAAAEQANQRHLARALLNERLALKPHSALNHSWRSRLADSLAPRN